MKVRVDSCSEILETSEFKCTELWACAWLPLDHVRCPWDAGQVWN